MKQVEKLLKNKYLFWAILLFAVGFPFIESFKSILEGSIPFWFDPARDFIMALENLKKLSLIGPPTGIPGIFYGPYWIWLISLAMLLTRDPRFIALLILTIPYFFIFPFILFKFRNIFGKTTCILLWLLFILSFSKYATFLWNPHLAALLFLSLVYLLVASPLNKLNKLLLAGLICGLIMNIHLSFGIGIAFASVLYIIIEEIKYSISNKAKWIQNMFNNFKFIPFYFLGIAFAFTPFILFESRHGFHQINAFVHTLRDAFFYNSSVVGQTGLNKAEIIVHFLSTVNILLQIPEWIVNKLFLLTGIYLLYQIIRGKLRLNVGERKLLLFLTLCSVSLVYLYLSSKNPVWEYHFIGVEIITLLSIGLAAKKFSLFRYGLIIWVSFLLLKNIVSFVSAPAANILATSSYATKKYIVELVYKDAAQKPFAVFAYSPSIYTYDYDYLFGWLGKHKLSSDLIYLIIPKSKEAIVTDFTNYRTPQNHYITLKEWHIVDGTTILKRGKIPLK